jgi:hypothetical protein
VTKLAPALRKTYGSDEAYSVGRIRRTLRLQGLSLEFERYAIAMFATRSDFVAMAGDTRDKTDDLYDALRLEVARIANHGSHGFMPKEWHDIGMDNGDNATAAGRWGVGL